MTTMHDILTVVVVGVLVYYLYQNFSRTAMSSTTESFAEESPNIGPSTSKAEDKTAAVAENLQGEGSSGLETSTFPASLLEEQRSRAPLQAEDLLPSDPNSAWSTINPEGRGSLAYKNFIEATHHFGIDTVGASHKNANITIRAEPINPRVTVSPWLQSTITPDVLHRKLNDADY